MSVDFPDWQQPQAIADHISITGAPLLRLTNPLVSQSGAFLGAASTLMILSDTAIDQPSYEAAFTVFLPAASGTVPFMQIQLQWINFLTSVITDVESFMMPMGNGSGNAVTCYLSGPVRGSALTVNLINLDPAQNATVSYDVNATSHVYTHDRLFQPNYPVTAPQGFTSPGGNPTAGVIAETQPTVGPSGTVGRLIACWNGRVYLSMDNSAVANGVAVIFVDPATLYGTVNQFGMQRYLVAAGGQLVVETVFPNGPVLMNIHNTGATGNTTCAISVTKAEY